MNTQKKSIFAAAALAGTLFALSASASAGEKSENIMNTQDIRMTAEWDKTFPRSENVDHAKITFRNRYGITLAADLYRPKNVPAGTRLAAIAVSGPYGAVKEQVSGRYAQKLAERGFLTLAFDPSFTGESGGEPRALTSPEISTDDFSAAVDYLLTRDDVAPEKIGILGVCGWGGFALNAAANDPRIRATATSVMYDMSRVKANGYFDSMSADDRYELRRELAALRTEDYRRGEWSLDGGVIDPVPADAPLFVRQYHDYYKTARGRHPRSPNSNNGKLKTAELAFINMPILSYIEEIRTPVLIVCGENAHSRYFSEDAFARLAGTLEKELLVVPGANHTDLYDREDVIPFDAFENFFRKNLN